MNAYFEANPDVAAAYEAERPDLTPDEYAYAHYHFYGASEGRSAPDLSNVSEIFRLFTDVLGQVPSAEDMAPWREQFGDNVTRDEFLRFVEVAMPAQGFKQKSFPLRLE